MKASKESSMVKLISCRVIERKIDIVSLSMIMNHIVRPQPHTSVHTCTEVQLSTYFSHAFLAARAADPGNLSE